MPKHRRGQIQNNARRHRCYGEACVNVGMRSFTLSCTLAQSASFCFCPLCVMELSLAEVCTGHASNLCKTSAAAGVGYAGFGLHNDHDMNTTRGYDRVARHCLQTRPTVTVLSPRCTYYSSRQNANQSTPRQRRILRGNRQRDRAMFSNTFNLGLQLVHADVDVPSLLRGRPWKAHMG